MFFYTMMFLLLLLTGALGFFLGAWTHSTKATNIIGDIVDFHEKFGLEYDGPPRVLPFDLADFREKFMNEELAEYKVAGIELRELMIDQRRPMIRLGAKIDDLLELQLDALVDLTYVVVGTAYIQFGPYVFAEAWRRVHEKNMQKVRKLKAGTGHTDSGRAAEFDVVKPAGWTPPSHLDLIQLRHEPLELS